MQTLAVSIAFLDLSVHSPLIYLQGSDVPGNIWTMVELRIAIVSACLPTMRPLFSRATGVFGPGSGKSGMKNGSESDPSLNLQQTPSDPSQSRKFAHIGILGDLEHGQSRNVSLSEKI